MRVIYGDDRRPKSRLLTSVLRALAFISLSLSTSVCETLEQGAGTDGAAAGRHAGALATGGKGTAAAKLGAAAREG